MSHVVYEHFPLPNRSAISPSREVMNALLEMPAGMSCAFSSLTFTPASIAAGIIRARNLDAKHNYVTSKTVSPGFTRVWRVAKPESTNK
jgi:hypothetical protein